MSTENWLLFKSPKEALKAKTFLAPLDKAADRLSFRLNWVSPMRLEISVSAGRPPEVHQFVQREVCRRIGADSTGWWPDSEIGAVHPEYASWAAWAKAYKAEWSHYLPNRKYWPEDRFELDYARLLREVQRVEARVVREFQRLDAQGGTT